MEIYISRNGEQEGPYSTEQLQERIRSGTVPGDAFYWHEGCEGWLPVREHPGFAPPPTSAVRPPPPPPAPTPPGANATPATLNHCAVCGRAVAPTAQTCPQCGHKLKRKLGCLPKLAIGVGVAVILFFALGIIELALLPAERRRSPAEAPAEPNPGSTAHTTEGMASKLPASEAALISTVQSYVARYASARNELQKSTVRTERQAALAKLMTGMEVSDWVGTLKDMSTYSDGKASIKIELNGSPITVHTDLGNPFEPGTDTSIAHGSTLYNQLSALSVGDPVRFSGSFLPGERDHFKETSFTESGAMTQPEFVMRFSEVSAASAATSSGLTASPTSRVARAEAPPEDALPPRALVTPSPAPETSPEPLPSAASTPTPNVPPPRSVVSDFFSWYLDAVRRGRSPWLEGELSKRPEISHGFAVRLENAKEPEPGNDPIFSTGEVPGAIEITDTKVNAFDATVAVRLGSGNTTRLVNVRLVRSDDSEPWQIDDVQPVIVGSAVQTPAPTTPVKASGPSARQAVSSSTQLISPYQTAVNFYGWYIEQVKGGKFPWRDGLMLSRTDISRAFILRLQDTAKISTKDDPVLVASVIPDAYLFLTPRAEGHNATVVMERSFGSNENFALVRLIFSADARSWQINDVQPISKAEFVTRKVPPSPFSPAKSTIGSENDEAVTPHQALAPSIVGNSLRAPESPQTDSSSPSSNGKRLTIEKNPDVSTTFQYTDITDGFFYAIKAQEYDKAYQELFIEYYQNPDTSNDKLREFVRHDRILANIQSVRYLKVDGHDNFAIIKTEVTNTQGSLDGVDFL